MPRADEGRSGTLIGTGQLSRGFQGRPAREGVDDSTTLSPRFIDDCFLTVSMREPAISPTICAEDPSQLIGRPCAENISSGKATRTARGAVGRRYCSIISFKWCQNIHVGGRGSLQMELQRRVARFYRGYGAVQRNSPRERLWRETQLYS